MQQVSLFGLQRIDHVAVALSILVKVVASQLAHRLDKGVGGPHPRPLSQPRERGGWLPLARRSGAWLPRACRSGAWLSLARRSGRQAKRRGRAGWGVRVILLEQ